jgi:hypothetical protein
MHEPTAFDTIPIFSIFILSLESQESIQFSFWFDLLNITIYKAKFKQNPQMLDRLPYILTSYRVVSNLNFIFG